MSPAEQMPTRSESLRKLIHAAFHLMDDSETDAQTEVVSIDNEIAADDLKEMGLALDELGIYSHEDIDELLASHDALLADAARYHRVRCNRRFVGMLEFAVAHASTEDEYDTAVDSMPAPVQP